MELQLRVGAGTRAWALLQYHRRPSGVSIEQQQGLIVAFDTARHYVLPLWADLEMHQNTHAKVNNGKLSALLNNFMQMLPKAEGRI